MSANNTGGGMSFWIKALVIMLLLGLGYWFGISYLERYVTIDDVLTYIKQSGPLAPLVFIIAYGCLPLIPATALTIASGALFGPFWGTVYSLAGATIAMSYPFWLTRWFGKKPLDLILRHTGSFEGRFEKFQCKVEKEGWKYVAFTRLVPLFPFTLLNYFFGLTRIAFWKYLLTSVIFIIPATATYVYLGYAGREAAVGSGGLIWKIVIALAILCTLAGVPKLLEYLKKKGSGGKNDDEGCG